MVTRDLLAVVRRVKELGTTVIIVEQSVANALSVADTVTFMDKGVVSSSATPRRSATAKC